MSFQTSKYVCPSSNSDQRIVIRYLVDEADALGGQVPGPAVFARKLLAYDLPARLPAVGDFERGLPAQQLVRQDAARPGGYEMPCGQRL